MECHRSRHHQSFRNHNRRHRLRRRRNFGWNFSGFLRLHHHFLHRGWWDLGHFSPAITYNSIDGFSLYCLGTYLLPDPVGSVPTEIGFGHTGSDDQDQEAESEHLHVDFLYVDPKLSCNQPWSLVISTTKLKCQQWMVRLVNVSVETLPKRPEQADETSIRRSRQANTLASIKLKWQISFQISAAAHWECNDFVLLRLPKSRFSLLWVCLYLLKTQLFDISVFWWPLYMLETWQIWAVLMQFRPNSAKLFHVSHEQQLKLGWGQRSCSSSNQLSCCCCRCSGSLQSGLPLGTLERKSIIFPLYYFVSFLDCKESLVYLLSKSFHSCHFKSDVQVSMLSDGTRRAQVARKKLGD